MPAQKCGLEQGSGGLCVFQVHKLPRHIRHDAERGWGSIYLRLHVSRPASSFNKELDK